MKPAVNRKLTTQKHAEPAATACGLSHTVILNAANNTAGVKLAENIDTQPRNANATKNMTNQPKVDNSYHWENPKICCTCLYYSERRRNPFSPPMECNLHMSIKDPHQAACASYSPKQTD